MNTNYVQCNTTTANHDTRKWHKILVPGFRGIWVVRDWLKTNKKELIGGYMQDGNSIRFQKNVDAVFCRLSIDGNANG
jgi:hypothetical protein